MFHVRYWWMLLLPTVFLALYGLTGKRVTQYPRIIGSTNNSTARQSASVDDRQWSPPPPPPQPPELFVYISSWMEGMSSWIKSVSEILVLSKELNATFVEPCISNGRLMSCNSTNDDTDNGTMTRLGQVLDMELLKTYYNRIIPYEEFIEASGFATAPGTDLSVPVVCLCMHFLHKWPREKLCEGNTSYFNAAEIPQIDNALDSAQHMTTVLEITQYRKGAFGQSKWIDRLEADTVKHDFVQFAPDNFRRANELLASMGIQNGQAYSVIHWRAELPNIDYMDCADRIIQTRNVMEKGQRQGQHLQQQHPFILMSSLNTNSNYMWGGAQRISANTTSAQALQKLFDHGFLKLDQVVDYEALADPGLLAVYDLILAMNAQKFATCTRQCTHHGFCGTCNWLGNFAGLAVTIRNDMANKSSLKCWPE